MIGETFVHLMKMQMNVHETVVEMIWNVGSSWQLFSKWLVGTEL